MRGLRLEEERIQAAVDSYGTAPAAEILGPRELKRDIGNRLFMYRGDMQRELSWYHPHSAAIIESRAKPNSREASVPVDTVRKERIMTVLVPCFQRSGAYRYQL